MGPETIPKEVIRFQSFKNNIIHLCNNKCKQKKSHTFFHLGTNLLNFLHLLFAFVYFLF